MLCPPKWANCMTALPHPAWKWVPALTLWGAALHTTVPPCPAQDGLDRAGDRGGLPCAQCCLGAGPPFGPSAEGAVGATDPRDNREQ